jgi:hypothetical protein
MTIKELIAELQKHPNPDADIIVTVNLINADDEEHDIECRHLEIWGEGAFENDYLDLFITNTYDTSTDEN